MWHKSRNEDCAVSLLCWICVRGAVPASQASGHLWCTGWDQQQRGFWVGWGSPDAKPVRPILQRDPKVQNQNEYIFWHTDIYTIHIFSQARFYTLKWRKTWICCLLVNTHPHTAGAGWICRHDFFFFFFSSTGCTVSESLEELNCACMCWSMAVVIVHETGQEMLPQTVCPSSEVE